MLSALGSVTRWEPRTSSSGAVEALLIDPEVAQDSSAVALALHGDGDEQVLRADELVLEPLGLGLRVVQQPGEPRRRVDLVRALGHLGLALRAVSTLLATRAVSTPRLLKTSEVRPLSCLRSAKNTCSTSHCCCSYSRTRRWESLMTSWACSVNLSGFNIRYLAHIARRMAVAPLVTARASSWRTARAVPASPPSPLPSGRCGLSSGA